MAHVELDGGAGVGPEGAVGGDGVLAAAGVVD